MIDKYIYIYLCIFLLAVIWNYMGMDNGASNHRARSFNCHGLFLLNLRLTAGVDVG
jgi:hypothetical protein